MAQWLLDYSIVATFIYFAIFGSLSEIAPPRIKHRLWMPGLAIAILLAVASTLSMLQPIDQFAAICGFTVFVALTIAGSATNACVSCGKIGPGIAWHMYCRACDDETQIAANHADPTNDGR